MVSKWEPDWVANIAVVTGEGFATNGGSCTLLLNISTYTALEQHDLLAPQNVPEPVHLFCEQHINKLLWVTNICLAFVVLQVNISCNLWNISSTIWYSTTAAWMNLNLSYQRLYKVEMLQIVLAVLSFQSHCAWKCRHFAALLITPHKTDKLRLRAGGIRKTLSCLQFLPSELVHLNVSSSQSTIKCLS